MSSQSRNTGDLLSHAVGKQPLSDRELRLREALVMWLRWNEAHERITEQLFAEGCSPQQTEALLDQLDALRQDAIRLTNESLD